MTNKRNFKLNSGQALVEFALSIMVLMFFVFGIFEVGRLFHMKIVLANSAREGARYLIRHVSDGDPEDPDQEPFEKTIKAILDEAKGSGITITADNIDVDCPVQNNVGCRSSENVSVTISVVVDVGIVSNFFGNIDLEEVAIMRTP